MPTTAARGYALGSRGTLRPALPNSGLLLVVTSGQALPVTNSRATHKQQLPANGQVAHCRQLLPKCLRKTKRPPLGVAAYGSPRGERDDGGEVSMTCDPRSL